MTFFTDADQIYAVMKALFEQLSQETPDPVDTLVASRMSIRLKLFDPEAQILINAKKRPVEINYGLSDHRVDLEIEMSADHLHQILLDEYSIKQGFANGELKVRGPVWKTLAFADIFTKGRVYYQPIIKDQGLA